MKKIILTVFAATSLLLYSTPSFALFSVSVGVPMVPHLLGQIPSDGVNDAMTDLVVISSVCNCLLP